ncbi:MAG: hypothetical protein GFH27_549289n351 [Chloroflexi bacterium AL-W]|nr:hypothetical protein [Chloroflexi bacterium AL-N1]NOK67083.1 hypothetical protein [Chloroflexi bacterium AL-N10]NOK74624.1 hypothetical protein [Chloroflexi bacterium AL-N5]NOK81685.1 hypothetical protein [Chloroflexi bacterium AL-W]NOK89155.1 hypothetical protein [Chloroflexi bacterium AL-N15]
MVLTLIFADIIEVLALQLVNSMKYVLSIFIIGILVACGSVSTTESQPQETPEIGTPMPTISARDSGSEDEGYVQLNIFSGREQPDWNLTRDQTKQLAALVEELPRTDQTLPETGLGYSGFEVYLPNPDETFFDAMIVYNGIIEYRVNEIIHYLTDNDREVERFLLASAESHVDDAVYTTLQDEIASSDTE